MECTAKEPNALDVPVFHTVEKGAVPWFPDAMHEISPRQLREDGFSVGATPHRA